MCGTRNIAGQTFHRPVPRPERVPAAEHAHAIHILWWVLAATVVLTVVWYLAACLWRPWGHCWCCKGKGRHSRRDGKVWHDCRICRGTGKRMRIGRKIWNHMQRTKAGAK